MTRALWRVIHGRASASCGQRGRARTGEVPQRGEQASVPGGDGAPHEEAAPELPLEDGPGEEVQDGRGGHADAEQQVAQGGAEVVEAQRVEGGGALRGPYPTSLVVVRRDVHQRQL